MTAFNEMFRHPLRLRIMTILKLCYDPKIDGRIAVSDLEEICGAPQPEFDEHLSALAAAFYIDIDSRRPFMSMPSCTMVRILKAGVDAFQEHLDMLRGVACANGLHSGADGI